MRKMFSFDDVIMPRIGSYGFAMQDKPTPVVYQLS